MQKENHCISINLIAASDYKNVQAERCTDAPANRIFSGPMTHLLSMLHVSMKILSHASAKKKTQTVKGVKLCTFIGRFQMTLRQIRG